MSTDQSASLFMGRMRTESLSISARSLCLPFVTTGNLPCVATAYSGPASACRDLINAARSAGGMGSLSGLESISGIPRTGASMSGSTTAVASSVKSSCAVSSQPQKTDSNVAQPTTTMMPTAPSFVLKRLIDYSSFLYMRAFYQ